MRYEEFKEELLREMRLYVMLQMPHPEEYRIEDLGKCYKNNLKQDEICVYREQDDAGVCVYPEKEYEDYLKGRTVREIVKAWPGWYKELPEQVGKAVRQLKQSWEQTKEKLMLRLIQIKRNQNFLQRVPWRELENTDLGIMYHLQVDDSSSIPVTYAVARKWKVGEEELYQTAYQNLQNEKCIFSAVKYIRTPVGPFLKETSARETEESHYDPRLTYMVYADRQYGTAAVLNKKVMENVKNIFGSRFFLFALDTERMVLIHETDHRKMEETLQHLAEKREEHPEDVEFELSNNMYVWEEGRLSLFEQKE